MASNWHPTSATYHLVTLTNHAYDENSAGCSRVTYTKCAVMKTFHTVMLANLYNSLTNSHKNRSNLFQQSEKGHSVQAKARN